jgi:hypothetical protein
MARVIIDFMNLKTLESPLQRQFSKSAFYENIKPLYQLKTTAKFHLNLMTTRTSAVSDTKSQRKSRPKILCFRPEKKKKRKTV